MGTFNLTLSQAGYLPTSEPMEFDTFENMKDYIESESEEIVENAETDDFKEVTIDGEESDIENDIPIVVARIPGNGTKIDWVWECCGDDLWTNKRIENAWEIAIKAFPYELEFTSIEQGSLERDSLEDEIEFSSEYTYEAGQLHNEKLVAGGWIDFRLDNGDNEPSISGLFTVARNGDFQDSDMQIFGECEGINCSYDITTETWDCEVGSY
ncbi:hypothetical protein LCGC14_0923660 [marine sediment metagenome]|uniref:Uncharacterized protein n=1 Tax=marine sediment metagenome TaxID=412755 RepID=A0A0F9NUV1_9ZZZZ